MNRPCILLVDLQRDFLEGTGRLPIGATRAAVILSRSIRILAAARSGMVDVIFIVSEFSPTDRFANFFRKHSALRGSAGAEIDPRIVADGFPVFSKRTSDAFSNPELLTFLRKKEFTRLAIAGVFAEGCVRSTANSAVGHGYEVSVISDAVESDKDWKKRVGLWSMRKNGARIKRCDEFLDEEPNKARLDNPLPRRESDIEPG